MQEKSNKNGILIIILLALASVLVLFFPKIYNFIISLSMPRIEEIKEEKKEDNKKIDESILEDIHFPMMRNSIYNEITYYQLEKFTIDSMSNNDILLNAYLDIYEGNMTSYEGVGACTNVSKQFSKSYLELRVKNILSNKLNYQLESFYVPEDLDNPYVGTWNYDYLNQRFTYVGLCQSNMSNIKYYDLEELIKLESNNDDIIVYYYVGFARVEGNNFIIYSDANMTKELKNGTFTNLEELNNIFKSINKNNKNIYKYTFKNNLCSYGEYCLYKGEWINEL